MPAPVVDISTLTVTLNAGGGTPRPPPATTNRWPIRSANNGSGGLTKAGLGTLTVSAVNTYTGNTNRSAGNLERFGGQQPGCGRRRRKPRLERRRPAVHRHFRDPRARWQSTPNSIIDVTGANALTLSGALSGFKQRHENEHRFPHRQTPPIRPSRARPSSVRPAAASAARFK